MIPQPPGYSSIGSRRYQEWQTLAYEATADRQINPPKEWIKQLVDHPEYVTIKQVRRGRTGTPWNKPSVAAVINQQAAQKIAQRRHQYCIWRDKRHNRFSFTRQNFSTANGSMRHTTKCLNQNPIRRVKELKSNISRRKKV